MNQIIKSLNQIGQKYIDESFHFIESGSSIYTIKGACLSKTIISKSDKVAETLKWLDLFWIYIEIYFVFHESKRKTKSKNKTQFPNIIFSLTIFQGSKEEMNKHQVFRAEWDNKDAEKENHPQPHWHFHYCKNLVRKFEGDNLSKFGSKEINSLNFDKFHFAMNGQWANSGNDIHRITTEDKLINWFSGIIIHIRKELNYIKKKSKIN